MDINFQKKTKRLVLRPYKISDYDLWRETFLNLGKAKNRWDKGARTKDVLTMVKFKKILSTQKKNRDNDYFYDLIAFDKKTGAIIGFASLMEVSRAFFKMLIWDTEYLVLFGEKVMGKKWSKRY